MSEVQIDQAMDAGETPNEVDNNNDNNEVAQSPDIQRGSIEEESPD